MPGSGPGWPYPQLARTLLLPAGSVAAEQVRSEVREEHTEVRSGQPGHPFRCGEGRHYHVQAGATGSLSVTPRRGQQRVRRGSDAVQHAQVGRRHNAARLAEGEIRVHDRMALSVACKLLLGSFTGTRAPPTSAYKNRWTITPGPTLLHRRIIAAAAASGMGSCGKVLVNRLAGVPNRQ